MTPLRQRLVTLLIVAGPHGMSGDDLFRILHDGQIPRYRGGHTGQNETRKRTSLKSLIQLTNKELSLKGERIVGERVSGGWYRLVKRTASRPDPSQTGQWPSRPPASNRAPRR